MEDGKWIYPDHEKLLKECGLLEIDKYIERRRGTLRDYLKTNRPALLESAQKTRRHAKDANRILWWNQSWKSKTDLNNHSRFWFNDSN